MLPILIHFGRFEIATYGLLVALAYLVGILWLNSQMKNMGLSEDRFWALIYSVFIGAFAGAKLLYMVLEWRRMAIFGALQAAASFPAKAFVLLDLLRYGWVFYGGFLGGVLAGYVYANAVGLPLLPLADYFGVAAPLSHWLGRMGCLAAGCCYGSPTEVPWAIKFNNPRSLVAENLLDVPLHPTQVYEAIGDIFIAIFLYKVLLRVQQGKIRKGTVFFAYILLYAALRFFVEFYRGDDRGGFWMMLSISQWIAIFSFASAGALMWRNGIQGEYKRPVLRERSNT